MNRRRFTVLLAVFGASALVGGLVGAASGLALGDSGGDSPTASSGATTVLDAPPPRSVHALSAEAVYRAAAPGVVVITDTQTQKVPATALAPALKEKVRVLGSGFVLDRKGEIVTNEHVVENGKDVEVGFSAGATYRADVVGTDPSTDVAVLRVDAPQSALHPLRLADSSAVQVGDTVYAIGNPFGLDRTMTAGIVSAVGRQIQAPNGVSIPNAIQTDAPINHGNSGGPLLDDEGDVIGINDQLQSGGVVDGNVGVGFAVASNTVGVVVMRVLKGSPAARAGLRAGTKQVTVDGQGALVGGDVIVGANGKAIRTPAELADVVAAHMPGAVIAFEVSRNNRVRTVSVRLGNAP